MTPPPVRDAGSSLPFVLLCFLIAGFLVFGVTAASAAFLAQRDLQADCDSAVVAAASGVDPAVVYGGNLHRADALPLATEHAEAALADHLAGTGTADATLAVTVSVDADQVTLECRRVVQIPFGRLFGVGAGLERAAVSTARSPLRP